VPASYTTIKSLQTVQVLSQTESLDVQAVTIQTVPHLVLMVVQVPLTQFQKDNEAAYLTPPAELVEQLFAGGIVSAASQVQTTDSSELLAYFLQVTVTYSLGTGLDFPFTTKVLIPMSALASFSAFGAWEGDESSSPLIVAYNHLVDLAGGPASDKLG